MIGFKIDQAKNFFFDRQRVLAATDRATQSRLSRAGAFIRRTAKGLIRKGKKPSKPGRPPKSHVGTLKDFLYFAFDPFQRSVVIGPAKTNQVFFDGDGRPVTGTVPEVLEYGGSISILEWQVPENLGTRRAGQWVRADLRFKRNRQDWKRRKRTVRIAARPYMQPAYTINEPKIGPLWADAITERSAA